MKICSRELCRRLYGQNQWVARWPVNLQSRLIAGSARPKGNNAASRCNGSRVVEGRTFPMVRRAEGLGGLRAMGITQRPADRASVHGVRVPLPQPESSPARIEEQHQEKFLQQARKQQTEIIMHTEEVVGAVPGLSLAAADGEHASKLGENSTDVQKETAEDFTRRSEVSRPLADGADIDEIDNNTRLYSDTAAGSSGPELESPEAVKHTDPNGIEEPSVDEDVKKGLIDDSEFEWPLGRKERVPEDRQSVSARNTPSEEKDEATHVKKSPDGVRTGVIEDWVLSNAEDSKVHVYDPGHVYSSTDETLDKAQRMNEEAKAMYGVKEEAEGLGYDKALEDDESERLGAFKGI